MASATDVVSITRTRRSTGTPQHQPLAVDSARRSPSHEGKGDCGMRKRSRSDADASLFAKLLSLDNIFRVFLEGSPTMRAAIFDQKDVKARQYLVEDLLDLAAICKDCAKAAR